MSKKIIKKNKYLYIVPIAILAIIFLLFSLDGKKSNTANSFADIYNEYAELSMRHEAAAYDPGTDSNEVRQELDRMLAIALTGDITPSDRLELSKDAVKLIDQMEEQIDLIGDKGVLVEQAIKNLEESNLEIDNDTLKGEAEKIIEMAQDRFDIISDIRGLSYSANSRTGEIFKRIIKDKGRLTDDHIIYLNQQIPKVEKQFDKRSNLYMELRNVGREIKEKWEDIEISLK